jgi:cytochrome c5
MKHRLTFSLAIVAALAGGLAVTAQNPTPAAKVQTTSARLTSVRVNESAEGERRFETHCGRCHVPPDNLSPAVAKTVVRQMRVRANLSAEDQRLILKYLAP